MRRDLIALPDTSRVWIYQSPVMIDDDTTEKIKADIYDFTMQWASHGQELDCYGHLFHYQFLVLVVDGSNLPSGCSIDSSVHFIQGLNEKYNVDFLDRMTFTYLEEDHVHSLPSTDFKSAVSDGKINEHTLVFNNLVDNKTDFLEKWIVPVNESWHKRFL